MDGMSLILWILYKMNMFVLMIDLKQVMDLL